MPPGHLSSPRSPRSDGFPQWPEFDNPDFGMGCQWRVCAQDKGDVTADELTQWMDSYDEAAAYLDSVPATYHDPPYDEAWIEARWTTTPERVK